MSHWCSLTGELDIFLSTAVDGSVQDDYRVLVDLFASRFTDTFSDICSLLHTFATAILRLGHK